MLVGIVLLLSSMSGGQYPALPSAVELQREISAEGAEAVLLRLFADEAIFAQLSNAISTAQPEWLEIAVALAKVADAGASEEIEAAFSKALVESPDRVLPLLTTDGTNGPSLSAVCSGVMLGEDENETYMHRWASRAETNLRKAHPMTQVAKSNQQACMATLLSDFPKLKLH